MDKVYGKYKALRPLSIAQSELVRKLKKDRIVPLKFALRWKLEDDKREARARLDAPPQRAPLLLLALSAMPPENVRNGLAARA